MRTLSLTLKSGLALKFAAAVAILLSTPAILVAKGQQGSGPRSRRSNARRAQGGLRLFNEHIPPLIMEDGSLTIRSQRFSDQEHQNNPHRPHKYKKAGFNHIYEVQVVALTSSSVVQNYDRVLSGSGWRVKVWLEKLVDPTTKRYELVNPRHPEEPQIIVKGTPFEVEIDKETLKNCEETNEDPARPCKYEHEPYDGAHFRIAKVVLAQGNSPGTSLYLRPDRTKVYISIWFRHPHRR
jgi:hypothetical protein